MTSGIDSRRQRALPTAAAVTLVLGDCRLPWRPLATRLRWWSTIGDPAKSWWWGGVAHTLFAPRKRALAPVMNGRSHYHSRVPSVVVVTPRHVPRACWPCVGGAPCTNQRAKKGSSAVGGPQAGPPRVRVGGRAPSLSFPACRPGGVVTGQRGEDQDGLVQEKNGWRGTQLEPPAGPTAERRRQLTLGAWPRVMAATS